MSGTLGAELGQVDLHGRLDILHLQTVIVLVGVALRKSRQHYECFSFLKPDRSIAADHK